jgi:hypothetical protein
MHIKRGKRNTQEKTHEEKGWWGRRANTEHRCMMHKDAVIAFFLAYFSFLFLCASLTICLEGY